MLNIWLQVYAMCSTQRGQFTDICFWDSDELVPKYRRELRKLNDLLQKILKGPG